MPFVICVSFFHLNIFFLHYVLQIPWEMDVSLVIQTQEERIVEIPRMDDNTKPKIGGNEEGHLIEEDVVDDEEKDLLENNFQ